MDSVVTESIEAGAQPGRLVLVDDLGPDALAEVMGPQEAHGYAVFLLERLFEGEHALGRSQGPKRGDQ
jgi:hypothetical protein